MTLTMALVLVWLHFVADFLLQTDKVAINKSKRNDILALHVSLYILPFIWLGWQFVIVNQIAHFATDWVTSRTASWCYRNDKRHWFFVTIGFDQAIHLTTLFATYQWLVAE